MPEKLLDEDPTEGDDSDSLGAEIENLRTKIERIGPVNLLALKEVDELEERSGFLQNQRKDLVEALRSLDDTIREIDATCTERFVATFEQVNAVFAETFTNWTSPPHSSGTTSSATSSCITRSGLASGLSILFTATIRGTPAAFA